MSEPQIVQDIPAEKGLRISNSLLSLLSALLTGILVITWNGVMIVSDIRDAVNEMRIATKLNTQAIENNKELIINHINSPAPHGTNTK